MLNGRNAPGRESGKGPQGVVPPSSHSSLPSATRPRLPRANAPPPGRVQGGHASAVIIARAGAVRPNREVDGPRWVSRSSKPLRGRQRGHGWVRLPYTSATCIEVADAKSNECRETVSVPPAAPSCLSSFAQHRLPSVRTGASAMDWVLVAADLLECVPL